VIEEHKKSEEKSEEKEISKEGISKKDASKEGISKKVCGNGDESEEERNEEHKNKTTATKSDYYEQPHHALFYKYDVNKTGYVTKTQFVQMIKEEDSSCTQAEIDKLVRQADPSGSGKISFEGLLIKFFLNEGYIL